jgi:hypothetical protein
VLQAFLKVRKSVLQIQLCFGIKKKAEAFKGSVGSAETKEKVDSKGRLRFCRQVSIIIQRVSKFDQIVVWVILLW